MSPARTHVVLDPLDFLARLAALVPRPRANLTRYHGVFASNFPHRKRIVPRGSKRPSSKQAKQAKPLAPLTWMQRLKRVFNIDIERCPACGGTLRIIACIEDAAIVEKILRHIALSQAGASARPARAPPRHGVPFTDDERHQPTLL